MTRNLLPMWRLASLSSRGCLNRLSAASPTSTPLVIAAEHQLAFRRSFSISSTSWAKLYTEKHEWVEVEDKVGTVGISDYAQHVLGDIVFVQLPNPGDEIAQHDECGAIESVKAASEIYSPVSGKVTDKNKKVEDTPGLINSACYGDGWLYKIEIQNPAELKDLMDEDKYKKFVESQE